MAAFIDQPTTRRENSTNIAGTLRYSGHIALFLVACFAGPSEPNRNTGSSEAPTFFR
jgi:hypothetical protein